MSNLFDTYPVAAAIRCAPFLSEVNSTPAESGDGYKHRDYVGEGFAEQKHCRLDGAFAGLEGRFQHVMSDHRTITLADTSMTVRITGGLVIVSTAMSPQALALDPRFRELVDCAKATAVTEGFVAEGAIYFANDDGTSLGEVVIEGMTSPSVVPATVRVALGVVGRKLPALPATLDLAA